METPQFPTYENYKDSGISWIGKIPDHWQVTRNLGLFDERKEVNQPDMELLAVTIAQGVIKQSEITAKKDSSNEDKSKYKVVRQGDLAYNKMRMWQGAIGESQYDGIVSPAYIILNTKDKLYSRYFHYLYRTNRFIQEANRHSYGLCDDMNSLRYEDFKTIYSPTPPEKDVVRIVDFLDQKTAEIDAAIAKKQQLIQLLNEQKAILINRAVTKGLNPNVKMKDSGVAWIGKIPEHWEIKKLKFATKIFRGKFTHRPRNDPQLYDGAYPFVQTGDVARAGKYLTEYKQTLNEKGLKVSTLVPKGTVVITIAANIGDISILNFDACFPDSVVGFEPKQLQRDFLYYALTAMKQQFILSTTKNTQMNLNVDRIGNNFIPIPPKNEQIEIQHWCNNFISEEKGLFECLGRDVEKLQEFKQVLISGVTTGKIRV